MTDAGKAIGLSDLSTSSTVKFPAIMNNAKSPTDLLVGVTLTMSPSI